MSLASLPLQQTFKNIVVSRIYVCLGSAYSGGIHSLPLTVCRSAHCSRSALAISLSLSIYLSLSLSILALSLSLSLSLSRSLALSLSRSLQSLATPLPSRLRTESSNSLHKEKSKGIFRRVFCLPVNFGGFGVP